ncbi:hypothetical protein B9T62_18080 [Paenibacillus donghaensis]|uniref:Uncharacterized protein n=2 Tax=Paenibacillus donghaensis TaxID=414771 RepID=A0A2Z2KPA7_9BACL|nr:hypothetical protein [Paenibacillus donghaensis]ASA26375.1 hypothetical protein B9T62_18080 [Paenibacillus donghaensis]
MNIPFAIAPLQQQEFSSEDELIEKCKVWNLLSSTATRPKTYTYKGHGVTLPCEIVGYVDEMTVVVQFENKQQHCIHPSYLKEMQTASFGQRGSFAAEAEESGSAESQEATDAAEVQASEQPAAVVVKPIPKKAARAPKKPAVELPEEKLQMIARVKELTTVPNHFSDNDDEVIIYEVLSIEGHELAIEEVWSSHSATLKKLELGVGDSVSFEAKVVAKKLSQHSAKYKINNPSKMKKIN